MGVINNIRTNLKDYLGVVVAVGGALAAMVAPVVISAMASLVMWIGRMTLATTLLNAAMNLNPIVRIMTLGALAIGGALLAMQYFNEELNRSAGYAATIGDQVGAAFDTLAADLGGAWDAVKTGVESTVGPVDNAFKQWAQSQADATDTMVTGNGSSWTIMVSDINDALNTAMNAVINTGAAIGSALSAIPDIVARMAINAMNGMIGAIEAGINSVSAKLNSWLGSIKGIGFGDFKLGDMLGSGNIPPVAFGRFGVKGGGAADGRKGQERFDDGSINAGFQAAAADVGNIMSRYKDYNKAIDDNNAKLKANFDQRVKERAYARKTAGFQGPPGVGPTTGMGYPMGPASGPFDDDADGGGGKKKKGRKGRKNGAHSLEKQAKAMEDINRELERTYEEIDALGGTTATLDSLTEKFKREDRVRKFGDAMRKAGLDAEFIKTKTDELNAALAKKDALEKQRAAMLEVRDSIAGAFDSIGESLITIGDKGADTMENLAKAAESAANDILKALWQVAVINPLKNLVLGTNDPALGGGAGGGGGLGGIFGSLLGGIGSFFSSGWSPLGAVRRGIAINDHMRMATGGLLTKPTMMNTPGGPVLGGEAGTEAILPLQRDNTGRLGITATGVAEKGNGNVIVNVYAGDAKVQTEQRRGDDGTEFIDVIVEQAKNSLIGDVSKGGSAMNKALEGRYGLNPSRGIR